jgi:L-idonate 5-dehydrogenase
MRSLVIHAPKDLRVERQARPGPLGERDVLVRIGAGGICGSDLHYYHHGGFGTVRIQQPMVLGHEVAGTVVEVGTGVERLAPGDVVAVNPSRPCGCCPYCAAGQSNHCLDMRFYGSAMRMPHVQGAFRELLACDESQAILVGKGVSLAEAAFAEPLAVCLHAVQQSGGVKGRRVLVTGCGPIGCLAILAARHGGAREIVATDVFDVPLAMAAKVGADRTINSAAEPGQVQSYMANKGTFDIAFEASGNAGALQNAFDMVKPMATIVQVGLGGSDFPVQINTLVGKEIALRGTFRFHEEFAAAVGAINRREIDVLPLLTRTLPLAEAVTAFELASDRKQAMKVQLSFE